MEPLVERLASLARSRKVDPLLVGEWRLVTHHFDALESDLAARFGSRIKLVYPSIVKEFFGFPRIRYLNCGIIVFPRAPEDDPVAQLRIFAFTEWDPDSLCGCGLLPIADEGNDSGPLVVDLSGGLDADQAPIRIWDHQLRVAGDEVVYPNARILFAAAAHLAGGGSVDSLGEVGAGAAARLYAWWDH